MMQYPIEELHEDYDDGTMPGNVTELSKHVIGHKIASVALGRSKGVLGRSKLVITLDNGKRVALADTVDCCAFTELEEFLLNVDLIDHVILGVGTTEQYTVWHVFADMGDVLKLKVGWSAGNPFYYGYGFDIAVVDAS